MEMKVNREVLKARREKNNWTQHQLADMCGLSLRTIQRIEKTGISSKETVGALSAVFEIDREEFVIQPGKSGISIEALYEYRIAIYILLIAQIIGLLGILYSGTSLTEFQFQLATIVVSGSSLFAFTVLGVGAYKKGILKPQPENE